MARKLRTYSKRPNWKGGKGGTPVRDYSPRGTRAGHRVATPSQSKSSDQTQGSRFHR